MPAAQLPDRSDSPEQWKCWEVSFHQLCPAAHGAHSQRINPPGLLTAPKRALCSPRFHHFLFLSSPAERSDIRTLGEQRVDGGSRVQWVTFPTYGWHVGAHHRAHVWCSDLSDPKPKVSATCLVGANCWLGSQPPWGTQSRARWSADLSWASVPQGTLHCAQRVSQAHL